MKLTKTLLEELIREALEIHVAPENLADISPEEAYGTGYEAKGKLCGKQEEPDSSEISLEELSLDEEALDEVFSEKQRRWACAQMNKPSAKISKADATEMCKSKEIKS